MNIKKSIILFLIFCVKITIAQNDLKVGSSYQLNLQRKNIHADAWILHNAEFSKSDDILKWMVTDKTFGSRGIRFSYSCGGGIFFYADNQHTTKGVEFKPISRFFISNNGNVGIATTQPECKLDVNGSIKAREIKVAANGNTADFVFEEDYPLKPLSEVEQFVKENKHLPEIPSAKKMEKDGVNLAEMNKLLLQKVEELTLYVIEQKKQSNFLRKKVEELEQDNQQLKEKFKQLLK